MSNPDYDWRKRGADMQKLHPTGTPTAVAAAIAKVQESTYEQVPDVALPTPEETFAFLGKALAGLAQNMARDYWRISRNGPGLVMRNPRIVLQTILNVCPANVFIGLTNADGGPASPYGLIVAANSVSPTLDCLYTGVLWITQLSTVSGTANAASVAVGGTEATGQVYAFTINITGFGPVPITYTAIGGDTNTTVAAALAAAVNASAAGPYITAGNTGTAVTLTAKLLGSQTNGYNIGAASATGTGTLTATSFSGATAPLVELAGEYA
jgi:hypothetical protein